jgi:hypothetical protein
MQRQAILVCGVLVLIGGCVIDKPGVLDAGVDESGGPDEHADSNDAAEDDAEAESGETGMDDPDPDPEPSDSCAEALDILVVLDNSGSMSAFQRRLTDSFPVLIDGLDQAGVDWRLAVTTTDNGSIWCPVGTSTPEAGGFVFSSCKDRIGDFLFGNDIDVRDFACNDICALDTEELGAIATFSDADGQIAPRPWLQRENGQLNVAADVDDALRCLLPMGVNGCGFEQQLESMRLGLAHTTVSERPEYGFMRDDASLLVLFVTNEADGSIRPEFEETVYGQDGNRVFWSDPNSSLPTSAVSWNAGVECVGDPSGYDDCFAANKGLNGDFAMPADAVLYPTSRYKNVLTQIEDYKRAQPGGEGADVAVLAITGVETDGSLTYAEVHMADPLFQDAFGIGPGCSGPDGTQVWEEAAVPPVRIREVAGHLSTQSLASICAPSFDQHMLDLLDQLVGECP